MEVIQFKTNEQAAACVAQHYAHEPKLFMRSYGCQQNVNDGEKIKGVLQEIGFTTCDTAEEADMIVFNTCAVREHAELRVLGNLGALKHLKKENPSLIIAVCGCMAQQENVVAKIRKSYPYVDMVFGVNGIDLLPDMICQKVHSKKRVFHPLDERPDIVEGMPIQRDSTFRAWLPIMYGCDNFCSYCIVPYVRGRERSRKSADILAEFEQLVRDGYKDITLLGQNVNSYGKGLAESIDFADLLSLLCATEGDYRVRFMTSHPKDATKKLIDVMAQNEHISKYLHLPVQSGSDEILTKMNRRYNTASYLELVKYAREKMPDITFSSDIIVGFPGETEADYEKTVELIQTVGYMQLYTFIYSKRTGTPAADLPDDTTHKVKSDRLNALLSVQEEIVCNMTNALVGNTERVLVENTAQTQGLVVGRLDNNFTVEFAAAPSLVGTFVNVKITGARKTMLEAELLS